MELYPNVELSVETQDVNRVLGKVLTIIDASIADAIQRDALKDVIRYTIWDWVDTMYPKAIAGSTGVDECLCAALHKGACPQNKIN